MSRTVSQHAVDRAIIRALLDCGNYLCPEETLRDHVAVQLPHEPSRSEFDDSLKTLEKNLLVIDGEHATGRSWKITDAGRAWAKENRVR